MKIVLGRSRKKAEKYIFLLIFSVSIIVLLIFALILLSRFNTVFEKKAEHAARIKAAEIVNNAVYEVFSKAENEKYIDISSGTDGKIISMSADTVKMNKLKAEISSVIAECAKKSTWEYVYIPMGSLTEYKALQGVGPGIPVKVFLDGFAIVDFNDEFVSAGINQVKHQIFLTANTEFSAVSAVMSVSKSVSMQIPVAETVVIGDVPEFYGGNLNVAGN